MNQLQEIESFIEDRPDSALAVIREIDTTTLVSKESMAKYSLLHSMALYKNYIDTTDLGIVRPAVDYYSKKGTPDEKLKAFYYEGLIYHHCCPQLLVDSNDTKSL